MEQQKKKPEISKQNYTAFSMIAHQSLRLCELTLYPLKVECQIIKKLQTPFWLQKNKNLLPKTNEIIELGWVVLFLWSFLEIIFFLYCV